MQQTNQQFVKDDLLYGFQLDYDENGIAIIKKEIKAKVIGYNAKGEIEVQIISGFNYLEGNVLGTVLLKVGNESNESRQGGLFFDSITDKSPRIIIYDDVDEIDKINNQDNWRFLGGNLGGYIDEEFQPLGDHYLTVDGMQGSKPLFGLLSDYVFLRGKIHAKEGAKIGGFSVTEESNVWFLRAGSNENSVGLSDGEYVFFAGSNVPADAKAWVKNNGEAKFTNVTIDNGSYVKTSTLKDIDGIPFLNNIVFSIVDTNKISWTTGTITYKGVNYNISTGQTTTEKYITWTVGSTVLTKSVSIPTLNSTTFLLSFITSTNQLVASNFLNVIYADLISVNNLSAISANLGTVTAGEIIGVKFKTSNNYERIEITDGDEIQFYSGNFEGWKINPGYEEVGASYLSKFILSHNDIEVFLLKHDAVSGVNNLVLDLTTLDINAILLAEDIYAKNISHNALIGNLFTVTSGTSINVSNKEYIELEYTATTTVTSLTGGTIGQSIEFYKKSGAIVTFQNSTALKLAGATNRSLATGDSLVLRYGSDGYWHEKGTNN